MFRKIRTICLRGTGQKTEKGEVLQPWPDRKEEDSSEGGSNSTNDCWGGQKRKMKKSNLLLVKWLNLAKKESGLWKRGGQK